MQERNRNMDTADFSSLFKAIGEGAYCCGLALAAVAIVLSWHSLVTFKQQAATFMFVLANEELKRLRATAIVATALLGWSVLDMVYRQAVLTDVAMIDWEKPQRVRRLPLLQRT